ncbi:MAG: TetR/AcrR family transcriptional regulator [Solirubrobacterales bacterium]
MEAQGATRARVIVGAVRQGSKQEPNPVDRRILRGERRHRQLLEATLVVIERDSVAAVSHRTVAREAGVSPSAVAYHFESIDELLSKALTMVTEDFAAEIASAADISALVAAVHQFLTSKSRRMVAVYELYLLAARRPALLPAAQQWIDSVESVARRMGQSRSAARGTSALIDGLGLQAVLTGRPPSSREIAALLRRVGE